MSKYEVSKRGTPTYEKFIEEFIDKFEATFPNKFSREFLKTELLKNLKSIHKIKKGHSIWTPIFMSECIDGVYTIFNKSIKYDERYISAKDHETLHALSARFAYKRQFFIKFVLACFFRIKRFDVRAFEEGMTEFIADCMQGNHVKKYRYAYAQETTIVYRLVKIYGIDALLDYYLGRNDDLVKMVNQTQSKGFVRVRELCRLASKEFAFPRAFAPTIYHKRKRVIKDDFLFELYKKEHMTEVHTIEDFKKNLDGFFDFYDQDIYKICARIAREEKSTNTLEVQKAFIESYIRELKNLNGLLESEWANVGIDDMTYYFSLLNDKIRSLEQPVANILINYANSWYPGLSSYIDNQSQNLTLSIEDKKKALLEVRKALSDNQTGKMELSQKSEEIINKRR